MEILKLSEKIKEKAQQNIYDKINKIERQLKHFRAGGDLKGKEINEKQRIMIIRSLENELKMLQEIELEELFNSKPSKQEYLKFFIDLVNDIDNGLISINTGKNVLNEYIETNALNYNNFIDVFNLDLNLEQEQISRLLLN